MALFAGTVEAAAAPPDLDPTFADMRGRIERFVADRDVLARYHAVPGSPRRAEKLKAFYEAAQAELKGVDFASLPLDGQIDFLLFQTYLRSELQELTYALRREEEIAPLLPFAGKVRALEEGRREKQAQHARESAETISQIAQEAKAAKKSLEEQLAAKRGPTRVVARRAAIACDKLRETLKDWHHFYSGYDPEFGWWLKEPQPKAQEALADYAAALREKVLDQGSGKDEPLVGDPIGRAALLDSLATEMIPYTPEELLLIAEAEFAWCETEMKRAARDLGFAGDWRKALDHVANLHRKPGEQPQLIREVAEESIRFLDERQLVSVPPLCREVWRMTMMSAERQKVSPYFTGGEVISISYPTESMSHEDKLMSLRGNNLHFCRATVHHELIPGHHLQAFMAERYRSHRQLFRTPFLVEGWALHWEMHLWDLGFAKGPEDRVGMLFWRAHRCARILFSLKFHLGKMTAEEAVQLLVERVGHEPRNATAEVRRSIAGDYSPLYQAAYMLGGLQLRALHAELVGGKKMTERQFHDAVLRENAIPIEMIRASLTGAKLTKDWKPAWRFYEKLPPSKPGGQAN